MLLHQQRQAYANPNLMLTLPFVNLNSAKSRICALYVQSRRRHIVKTIIAKHPVWSFDIIAVSDDRRAIFSETSCLVDQVNCRNGNYLGRDLASTSAAFSDFYVNKIKLTVTIA